MERSTSFIAATSSHEGGSKVSERRFLITGAAGETGRYTTEALMKQNFPVRAFVHRDDEQAARLRARGAEVAVGDLLDLDQVREALDGISAAYFVYPIEPGVVDATAYFSQAAKEAGVGAIVNMSQISARRDAKSHAARDHWISERVFDWSGVPVTHLRPTFFAQWLLYPLFIKSIREHGIIRAAFGRGRHAPIAAEDQARLIAAILIAPGEHKGKTYPLYGPVELDHAGVASAVGEVLGKKITYEPIEIAQFREMLKADRRISPFRAQHLCAVAEDYQNGLFAGTDRVIESVTGHAPMTVQSFVALHRNEFASAGKV
jgi:NAD(P)H dehydrogenase (quinone)